MKILITGATGFIGKTLAQSLHQKGHSLVILSRSASSAHKAFPFSIEAYEWNLEKGIFPLESLAGVEGVIHLAGEPIAEKRWTAKQKEKILNSRVLGTRALVKALLEQKHQVKSAVFTSAIGFYGDRSDEALNEKSSSGSGFLSEVCQKWEKEVLESSEKLSFRHSIVRVGIVLGEQGGMLKKILPIFKLGVAGKLGSGRQWMSWIHIDDLVKIFEECLLNEKYLGIFNATAPVPVTNQEFTQALGHALKRPTFLPAPGFALKLALGEMSELMLGSAKVLPNALATKGFSFKYGKLEDALTSLVE